MPIAPGTMQAATAAAEPLDEPPGVRVGVVRIARLARDGNRRIRW